ncbi:MAG TPA: hypothetical protein VFO85_17585 [Vicinamibacteria bacterium]|nr:hypothetical protein [Vicinamibacteria bacterium]
MSRTLAALLLALSMRACLDLEYEYEHEFWLDVDGSGTVYVTGRPALWAAFKGLPAADDRRDESRRAARALFERAGLRVRRVTWTRRDGRPYLFVSADFEDVNRLAASGAFPDLEIALRPSGQNLGMEGRWRRPEGLPAPPAADRRGVMAVRFHLPSRVYEHRNAAEGLERGNIVAWRQEVATGLDGQHLAFGAVIDRRSILLSTVALFAGAILLGVSAVALVVYLTFRKGRAQRAAGG